MRRLFSPIVRYRHIVSKCALGLELDLDEIFELGELESQPAQDRVHLKAILRREGREDPLTISGIGLHGAMCEGASWIEVRDQAELAIPDDDMLYLFKVRATWTAEGDDANLDVAFEFIGAPVVLHCGPKTVKQNVSSSLLSRLGRLAA